MLNIKNQCNTIQKHIKKAKSNLLTFMYTPGGIMFIVMLPFVYLHKKHFNKVEEYVKKLNQYSQENNLEINFETFSEIENSAILYSQEQLGSLTVKQYDAKIRYLDLLNDKVESLKLADNTII